MNGDSDCSSSSSSSPLRHVVVNFDGGGTNTSSYSVQDILYPADALVIRGDHPAASFDPAVVIPPHHHYHSGLLAVTSPVPPITNNFGKKNFLIKEIIIKLSKEEEMVLTSMLEKI